MTARKSLVVVAGLLTASVAHAEDIPSNAELFRMLKGQQQTIAELRAELKQARQERSAARTKERREVETTAKQAGREAARETMAAATPAAVVAATTPAQAYAMYTKAPAVPQMSSRGAYVGFFGGGGVGSSGNISQLGTAFFVEAAGGPMSVNATGRSGSHSAWFVGGQAGYEWSYGSHLLPALEIEGLYLSGADQRATLDNPTPRLAEHTFDNTFPTNTAVVLANVVVGFRTPYQGVTPYIGGGMGVARVSVNGATSTQTNPPEAGINHFNSGTDSSAWTLAAQAKAGVRVALGNSGAYLFGEYRYLFIGSVDQTFGPTVDPTHVPTSQWTVRFDNTSYHLATAGVGFSF
ncbi:hypothetical protein [Rhodoplanes sp. Z2-YC6860]|uniref:hypothetical protein n=1 Tax=Rhodoplanes sp. Z2-YC6860 TaxID=674703 RepID=UPI00078D0060|nr:hypothetical protein [Rhodoplanes sp. Z2-YC6860]AMN44287.1 hypothetical protein RHPLAN_58760 [Rhodoplanes sp. Z2-YC6860]